MASRVRQPHDRPWSARAARAPRWVGLALAATLLLTPGASLAAGGVAGIDEEWSFQFTPYLWALAIDGDMTVGGTTTDVSLSFVDIVELMNFGVMGSLEARKERWFFGADGLFALLEDEEEEGPGQFSFGPTTLSKGPLSLSVPRVTGTIGPADVDIDITLAIAKFVAGYRLLSTPLGSDAKPRPLSVDLYAGGRYWYMKNKIHVKMGPARIPGFNITPFLDTPIGEIQLDDVSTGGVTFGGVDTREKVSTHHIDPIVGLRIQHDFAENWSTTFAGDIGGFGIGSASDFSWETSALVSWHFGKRWSLVLGYRALGIDRDGSSGSEVDVTLHGPKIGATYAWGGSKN